ncbi:MAG: hypothetical protein EOP36_09800 [Rubrivivax sp.]|nr:MAG: hypothetical protein EOP36_09800 [Rubrivivax sp.]
MKKSAWSQWLIAGALFASSMAAHAGASIYFQGECGSGASGCEVFATLQQNGPSATYSTSFDLNGDYSPVNFDLAYVGNTLVVTPNILNSAANNGTTSFFEFVVYDNSKPIRPRCYYCGPYGSPEERGNSIARFSMDQLPQNPAFPLVVNLPSLVPEVDAAWLALMGMGVVGMAFQRRRA